MISSSSKDHLKSDRIISPEEKKTESGIFQNTFRPKSLENYIGQETLKKHLQVSISSAKIRSEALEHVLFYGPPGLGKTTLSNILAHEMESHLRTTSGPAIEKQSDLVSILSNLEEGDILFIDEIHRLRPQVEEILYTAMEDYQIDIMVGSGTGAQSVKLPVKPFTLVGATTRLSALSAPLRDRFGNVLKLDFYEVSDISQILQNNCATLELILPKNILTEVAQKSRGTPRIANRLLKILRDYHTIGKNISDIGELRAIFIDIGVDERGLDYLDRKYLSAIYKNFKGGPVGLGTLASVLGEEEATLEDVVEPYLLQIGFIERTPRGRKISGEGMNHLRG
ncbi:Holliday junction branch migration DNA helicase RuvB [Candidatus Gracilibacteria bacterium]|nr:Holliday junction branch migration DNA helicase RuvB [Candidatus Gracilibacteria bacterium]